MSGPEFGPGGYLPPRAAKRARKIVLREQMGFGWPLAAVAASVLVLVAGGVFLYLSTRPPSEPFLPVTQLTDVPADGAAIRTTVDPPGLVALIVRAGGPVRAFEVDEAPTWCPQSKRLETADAAWTADGRLVYGDRRSLKPLRSVVHDGIVYVDFTTPVPVLGEAPGSEPPVCTST